MAKANKVVRALSSSSPSRRPNPSLTLLIFPRAASPTPSRPARRSTKLAASAHASHCQTSPTSGSRRTCSRSCSARPRPRRSRSRGSGRSRARPRTSPSRLSCALARASAAEGWIACVSKQQPSRSPRKSRSVTTDTPALREGDRQQQQQDPPPPDALPREPSSRPVQVHKIPNQRTAYARFAFFTALRSAFAAALAAAASSASSSSAGADRFLDFFGASSSVAGVAAVGGCTSREEEGQRVKPPGAGRR